jgi:hypothetical protein
LTESLRSLPPIIRAGLLGLRASSRQLFSAPAIDAAARLIDGSQNLLLQIIHQGYFGGTVTQRWVEHGYSRVSLQTCSG